MRRIRTILLAGVVLAISSATIRAGEYAETWKKGVAYLVKSQEANGAWSGKKPGAVGVTAVVLEALTMAPKSATEDVKIQLAMKKAADFLAGSQQADGSIHDPQAPKNYSTSLAVQALSKFDKKKYAPVIEKAVAWIKTLQADEKQGYKKDTHRTYGGFGYGSSLRPDLSNTWIALNALKDAGVAEDDPVWKKATIFIKRCQNSPEVNDQPYAGNDGGSMYLPAETVAETETTRDGKTVFTSYGSMTYAMVLSYLWCNLKKDDQPVKLAVQWIGKNYSVDKNPNTKKEGQQGLYYYYRVMAKSLDAYGEKKIDGHDWARDLAAAIARRQGEDGSWSNPQDRWREGDPNLATGYCLAALAVAEQWMKK